MSATVVNSTSFQKVLEEKTMPVLVDFYADWCGPCQMAAPIIEKLSDEYQGKAMLCKLNVDEARDVAMKYEVQSIPTVIIFKNGQEVDRQIGFPGEDGYVAMIEKALTASSNQAE